MPCDLTTETLEILEMPLWKTGILIRKQETRKKTERKGYVEQRHLGVVCSAR